jgi:hypothetical protein
MRREPKAGDFIDVTDENMDEVMALCQKHAYFLNGLLYPPGQQPPLSFHDVVLFPWKDVVQQLADLVEDDDG